MPEGVKSHLEALETLWQERRGGRHLPTRKDLGVAALKPWLGSLALFECHPAHGALFRICGTSLHERFGGELTGLPVSALEPKMAADLEEFLAKALATRRPQRREYVIQRQSSVVKFRELFLPLAGFDGDPRLVLFASYVDGRP